MRSQRWAATPARSSIRRWSRRSSTRQSKLDLEARLSYVKTEIHPQYQEAHVRCTCGNEFTTRSTQGEIHVEICSTCHPFYRGRQQLVASGGGVEGFRRSQAR